MWMCNLISTPWCTLCFIFIIVVQFIPFGINDVIHRWFSIDLISGIIHTWQSQNEKFYECFKWKLSDGHINPKFMKAQRKGWVFNLIIKLNRYIINPCVLYTTKTTMSRRMKMIHASMTVLHTSWHQRMNGQSHFYVQNN